MKLSLRVLLVIILVCQVTVARRRSDKNKVSRRKSLPKDSKNGNRPPGAGFTTQAYCFAETSKPISGGVFEYGWFTSTLNSGGTVSNSRIDYRKGTGTSMPSSFPFYIAGNVYVFSHGTSSWDKNIWRIQELRTGGHVSSTVTASGTWASFYAVLFPLYLGGKVFVYLHGEYGNRYYITELLLEGKLASAFIFAHTKNGNGWLIQEVSRTASLGDVTDRDTWNEHYAVVFSFYIDGNAFIFAHTEDGNEWAIYELFEGGKLNRTKIDGGTWTKFYSVMYPFEIDDEVYIYGQSNEDNEWFTAKVDSKGRLEKTEIQTKKWKSFYGTQFPFYV
eukprot:g7113.t1